MIRYDLSEEGIYKDSNVENSYSRRGLLRFGLAGGLAFLVGACKTTGKITTFDGDGDDGGDAGGDGGNGGDDAGGDESGGGPGGGGSGGG